MLTILCVSFRQSNNAKGDELGKSLTEESVYLSVNLFIETFKEIYEQAATQRDKRGRNFVTLKYKCIQTLKK
jgi:hypothetical protein